MAELLAWTAARRRPHFLKYPNQTISSGTRSFLQNQIRVAWLRLDSPNFKRSCFLLLRLFYWSFFFFPPTGTRQKKKRTAIWETDMLRGSAVHELDCKPLTTLEATSRSMLISNLTGTFSKKKKKRADFILTCQFAAKASEVDVGMGLSLLLYRFPPSFTLTLPSHSWQCIFWFVDRPSSNRRGRMLHNYYKLRDMFIVSK